MRNVIFSGTGYKDIFMRVGVFSKLSRVMLLSVLMVAVIGLFSGCAGSSAASIQRAQQAYAMQNYELAYRELQKPARHGDPRAEYALAFLYYKGLGAPYDPVKARELMYKSAAKKYPLAIIALKNIQAHDPNPYGSFAGSSSSSQSAATSSSSAKPQVHSAAKVQAKRRKVQLPAPRLMEPR